MNWIKAPGEPPPGCAGAWFAIKEGRSFAGIFEIMDGGWFMLAYHVLDEPKPRVERFESHALALQRGIEVLNGRKLIPRNAPIQ